MKNRRFKKASSRIGRREKAKKNFALVLKIGIPVAVLVGLVFLLRADFLQVKDFEVTGGETALDNNVKDVALGLATGTSFFVIPKSNILLLDRGNLAGVLLSKFTRIQKVDISKNFFDGNVKLSITERSEDFLWCSTRDECFFMDKSGLVFAPYDGAGTDLGKIIFKGVLVGDPIMKKFAASDEMQNYSGFIKTFADAGFKVDYINIESGEKGTAETNMGDVVFNPGETDLSLIAQNVILLINETKAKNHSAVFNYIDARFGNKIFYKLY
jgi:hypothetical protein